MYIRKIQNGVIFIKKGNKKIKLEIKSKQNVEVIVCLHVYRETQKSLFVYMYIGKPRGHWFFYMYIGKARSHCLFTCISENPEVIVCLYVYREIQKSLFHK
jgi:hypothetical protein